MSGKGHHKKQVSSNLSQWLEEDDDEEPENSTALLTYKSPTSMNTGASHHKASASTSSVSLSYNGSRKGSGDSGSMQKTKSAKTMPKQPQNQTQQQQQPSFVFTSSVSALWEWNGTQYQRVCEGPLGCVILDNKKHFLLLLYDNKRKTQATIPLTPTLVVNVLSASHVSFVTKEKCYAVHCTNTEQLTNLLRSITFSLIIFAKFSPLQTLNQMTSHDINDEEAKAEYLHTLSMLADFNVGDSSKPSVSKNSSVSLDVILYSVPTEDISNVDRKLQDIEIMSFIDHKSLQDLSENDCNPKGYRRKLLDWTQGLHESGYYWRVADSTLMQSLYTECNTGEVKEVSLQSKQWIIVEVRVKNVKPLSSQKEKASIPNKNHAEMVGRESTGSESEMRSNASRAGEKKGNVTSEPAPEKNDQVEQHSPNPDLVERMRKLAGKSSGGVLPFLPGQKQQSHVEKTEKTEATETDATQDAGASQSAGATPMNSNHTSETTSETATVEAVVTRSGIAETGQDLSTSSVQATETPCDLESQEIPCQNSEQPVSRIEHTRTEEENATTAHGNTNSAGNETTSRKASVGDASTSSKTRRKLSAEHALIVRDDSDDDDVPTKRTFSPDKRASYTYSSPSNFGAGLLERVLMDTGRLMNSVSTIEHKLDELSGKRFSKKPSKAHKDEIDEEEAGSFENIKSLVERVNDAIEQYEEKSKGSGKTAESLEEEVQMLHEQLEHARSDRSSLQRRVNSFQVELRETRKTLETVRQQLDESEDDNSRLREQLSSRSRPTEARASNVNLIENTDDIQDPTSLDSKVYVRGDIVSDLVSKRIPKEELEQKVAEKEGIQKELDELKSSMHQQIKQMKSQFKREAREAIRKAKDESSNKAAE